MSAVDTRHDGRCCGHYPARLGCLGRDCLRAVGERFALHPTRVLSAICKPATGDAGRLAFARYATATFRGES